MDFKKCDAFHVCYVFHNTSQSRVAGMQTQNTDRANKTAKNQKHLHTHTCNKCLRIPTRKKPSTKVTSTKKNLLPSMHFVLTISSGAKMPNCTRFTRRMVAFESLVAILVQRLSRPPFLGAPRIVTEMREILVVVVVQYTAAALNSQTRPTTEEEKKTHAHKTHCVLRALAGWLAAAANLHTEFAAANGPKLMSIPFARLGHRCRAQLDTVTSGKQPVHGADSGTNSGSTTFWRTHCGAFGKVKIKMTAVPRARAHQQRTHATIACRTMLWTSCGGYYSR